jgi:class 3 adenylate cyclase/tetratricopeptide (TPR) repeat protein
VDNVLYVVRLEYGISSVTPRPQECAQEREDPGDDQIVDEDPGEAIRVPEAAASVRTFLIADVRGYTQFTVEHGDEAAAKLAVQFATAARRVVSGRDGRVVELRGDEALAVFSSTRQALWASVELIAYLGREAEGAPPIRIGVGLDAGEAIPVDRGYRGATLNLAARLCSLAGPGEILASETVINLARKVHGLAYVDRGSAQLKGFADPVRVVRVRPAEGEEEPCASVPQAPATSDLRTLSRPASQQGAAPQATDEVRGQVIPIGGFLGSLPDGPLVARKADLDQILAAVDRTAARQGQTVLLAGEPGAGKTRLAQEVTLELRNRGFLIAAGRCYEAEQSVPYYPFLDALSAAYEAAPVQLQRDAARRWPYLSILLPNYLSVQEVAGGGQEEQRLFFAVASFIEAIAESVPVALLLDDLHWADPAALKLLLHLSRHTRSSRVFMLGAYRDIEVNRRHPLEGTLHALDREGLMRRLAVRRLDQEGTAALMASTMGEEEISDEFAGLVYSRTEGNPFFVQQVMRTLVERGDIYREGGRWERKAVETIQVPESVRSVIGQRLARLSEQTQGVLTEASVLGQTFAFEDLVGISSGSSQRAEADVERALDEAEAIGLVREVSGDISGFDHALTQQTLYGELSTRRRRRLHQAAGETIESLPERRRQRRTAELSWHFLQGGDLPKAAAYTVAAADEAVSVFAHVEAESRYRSALDLATEIDDKPLEARARFGLGSVLQVVGRYEEALQMLTRASSLYRALGDREAEMRAEAEIGRVYLYLGEASQGIPRLEAALVGAREGRDLKAGSRALAAATSILARLYWTKGDLDASLAAATRAAHLARAAGDNTVLAEAETRRGTILQNMGGHAEEARATHDAALAIAEEVGALDVVTVAAINMAVGFWTEGQFDRAESYVRRAVAASERLGDPDRLAFALHVLALVLFGGGSWKEARELAERAVRLSDAVGSSWGRPYLLWAVAVLDVFEGRWDEATLLLDEAQQLSRSTGDPTALLQVCCTQAWLSLLQEQPEQVVTSAEPLLDSPKGDLFFRLTLRERVARAWIELGDLSSAETATREVVESARENGLALVEAWTLPTLGCALARQDRSAEAREVFERAIEVSHAMPEPLNEAIARHEWGRMLVGAGDIAGAREQLGVALTLSRRLGAEPFIERSERLLASLQSAEETRTTR